MTDFIYPLATVVLDFFCVLFCIRLAASKRGPVWLIPMVLSLVLLLGAAVCLLASGGDIYGLRLDVSGLKFSDVNSSPALSDIDSARITSSRLSSYTVESVLRQELPFLEDISVSMDNDKLTIGGNVKGHSIVINFGVSIPKDGIIEIRPLAFSFMGVNFPEGMQFLLKIFAYRINLSENPYGLSAGSISMSSGIMEIK